MAGSWKMETRGFLELRDAFKTAPRKIQDIGREWTKQVAADETKLIRSLAPARTGKFKRTIVPYARNFVAGVEFLNYPKLGQKLRHWIVEGTKPHIIRAKRAKALRFPWVRMQRWGYFKKVRHPGTRPDDFIGEGIREFDNRVEGWLEVLGERIVEALAGK